MKEMHTEIRWGNRFFCISFPLSVSSFLSPSLHNSNVCYVLFRDSPGLRSVTCLFSLMDFFSSTYMSSAPPVPCSHLTDRSQIPHTDSCPKNGVSDPNLIDGSASTLPATSVLAHIWGLPCCFASDIKGCRQSHIKWDAQVIGSEPCHVECTQPSEVGDLTGRRYLEKYAAQRWLYVGYVFIESKPFCFPYIYFLWFSLVHWM
jgi:hypothetical protein